MKLIITGCKGYVGYPLLIELLANTNHEIVGIDNEARAEWVARCGGSPAWKGKTAKLEGFIYLNHDLTDFNFVKEILTIHKPDVIIHLASQPSMPYSQLNGERAIFTQVNNLTMLLNLLWGAKEVGIKPRFIVTTTTGISGQAYDKIPEGHTINWAGSWYHVSRGFDSANLNLASRQFGFEVVEFRTSIVYGLQTATMAGVDTTTRFDTDEFFGTALNRFIDQAINKKPITIYGAGKQIKPFISLNDTVISLANAIDYPFTERHTILNQVTNNVSINDVAEFVKLFTHCEVKHIPNPRQEKEDWQMIFENEKFLKVLGKTPDSFSDGIKEMIKVLTTDAS